MGNKTNKLLKQAIVTGCTAACMAYPLSAQAETAEITAESKHDLDNVVVTATMTEKALEDVPSSVEIITAKEIREMNALTVADALENATGLIVSSESGRTKAPSIRGTRATHTLVLVDGRRVPFGFVDMVDINQVPITMVERIEVLRGPSSALYGSDALGGVVNIITRKPQKKWTLDSVAQAGINKDGEGEKFLVSATANGFYKNMSLLVGGDFRGNNKWNRTMQDGLDEGDHIRMGAGSARLNIDIADGHTLSGGVDYTDRSMEGYRTIEAVYRNREVDDERLNYYLQYDGNLHNKYKMMLRLNRGESTNKIKLTPASKTAEEGTKENNLNQVEARFSGLFFTRHLVTFGTEFREEERKDKVRKKDFNNLSFFLQDEYEVTNKLFLVFGGRFDDNSEYGSRFTPRVSVLYDLIDKHLRLKASYGRGFRAPSLSELFVESWRQRGKKIYQPNPDLNPEKSESYEVGVEGSFGNYRGSLTFFRNNIDDMIDAVFVNSTGQGPKKQDYYIYRNISEATTQGIELESSVALPYGFGLTGNATWLDTENKNTGKDIEGQPRFNANLKLSYDHRPLNLHANLRASYIGTRHYSTGNESGYPLLHAYVAKGITENLKLFVGVDNIFNRAEQDPTFFYGGASIKF